MPRLPGASVAHSCERKSRKAQQTITQQASACLLVLSVAIAWALCHPLVIWQGSIDKDKRSLVVVAHETDTFAAAAVDALNCSHPAAITFHLGTATRLPQSAPV